MTRFLGSALLALALLAGCSRAEERRIAGEAVDAFHHQMDRERYAEIYRAGAPEFHQTGTEAQFVTFFQIVRQRLGRFRDARQTGATVTTATKTGTTVTLAYESRYERASVSERFVYRITDGRPALIRFDMNSPALADLYGQDPAHLPSPGGSSNEAAAAR
jgi:hypothetical protein